MIIMLSPAKSLDFDSPPTIAKATRPDFLDQSEILVERLREFSPAKLASLMEISDPLAVLNVARYAEWRNPYPRGKGKQAVLAFDGDVYEGLDARSLSSDDLLFAQDHLRILSGLYGMLRPLDKILPYRLEMGLRLDNPRGKDLYAFWGDRITEALENVLRRMKSSAVINLASAEYFRSVKARNLSVPVIEPVFEDWGAGKYKVVSFYAKRARGLMARFAVTRRIVEPLELKSFAVKGYVFDEAASEAARWVFRRKLK